MTEESNRSKLKVWRDYCLLVQENAHGRFACDPLPHNLTACLFTQKTKPQHLEEQHAQHGYLLYPHPSSCLSKDKSFESQMSHSTAKSSRKRWSLRQESCLQKAKRNRFALFLRITNTSTNNAPFCDARPTPSGSALQSLCSVTMVPFLKTRGC